MKKQLSERIREFFGRLLSVTTNYPVEIAIAGFSFVSIALSHEKVFCPEELFNLLPAPIFFTLAYVLNTHTRTSGRMRWIYYLSWLPIIAFWIGGISETWLEHPAYWITVCVLCPLAVLLCRKALDNKQFVCDTLSYAASGAIAGIFTGIAVGLFLGIYFSVGHIFHFPVQYEEHVLFYTLLCGGVLFLPLLFFSLLDRWLGRQLTGGNLTGFLLDWIVTPALLTYTAVLYLYTAKITITWTLPEGNVAYMVFGFIILTVIVQALRLITGESRYKWFFDRFHLLAIPLVALFWVGTVYRIGEYGLTQARVWLVICGIVMSVYIVLFAARRTGRYLYFATLLFGLFLLTSYVPPLTPERIALRSQEARIQQIATELGLLEAPGKIKVQIGPIDTTDYVLYHRLYESMRYLYVERDTLGLQRVLGISSPDQLFDRLPAEVAFFARNGVHADSDRAFEGFTNIRLWRNPSRPIEISGYNTFYDLQDSSSGVWSYANDTLTVRLPERPLLRIAGRDLLMHQLRKIGCPEDTWPSERTLHTYKPDMLRYEDADILIIMEELWLLQNAENTLTVNEITLQAILIR